MRNRLNGHSRVSIDVVRCPGDLNASHMVAMKSRVQRLVNQKHKFFLLDLQDAHHVDLAGLGILVDRIKRVRSLKGDIRLFNLQPEVMKTLRMVGLMQVIATFHNEEAARQSFQAA
jgi:anti-sigma B factor antagonist